MGVLIFGLFLWWIWPAADFDVKTVDYNMLTRIQEKIWKVAVGTFSGSWNGEAGTVPSVSFVWSWRGRF